MGFQDFPQAFNVTVVLAAVGNEEVGRHGTFSRWQIIALHYGDA
jgi:hypothetical protein